jgi:DNA-binding ferritin-like protein (Dps family)
MSNLDPKNISKSIDVLSATLPIIEQLITAKVSKEYIDYTARLNRIVNEYVKINDSCKSNIKSYLIDNNDSIIKGNNFEAVLKMISKSYLNTEKVKAFLGKKLPQFQTIKDEYQLSFRPKT